MRKDKKKGILYFLSWIFMGLYHMTNGQLVKGILFLVIEVLFLVFMGLTGIQSLLDLRTLGTQEQGWVYDENLGIEVQVDGDNSMLILIYGIVALVLLVIFICFYVGYRKSVNEIISAKEKGNKIPGIKEDLKSLLDQRFHLTLLSVPALGVLLFTIIPLVYMISIAFTSYDHSHLPPKNLFSWVGFENFGNVFTGRMSETFVYVLIWTLIWAVCATFTCCFFGILLAMFIQSKSIRWKKMYRSCFVMSIAVPQFVSLVIMQNLFHRSGPINEFLLRSGIIDNPIPFLTDPLVAKIFVIVINMWVGVPVYMLISTGVIMNIPQDQVESARIDGANAIQIFRKITLPQILFVMTPNLIQQFIAAFNNFNVVYLLTQGGPANSDFYGAGSTDLLVTWLYKLTMDKSDYNLASVIGIITFLFSAIFSIIMYTRSKAFRVEGEM